MTQTASGPHSLTIAALAALSMALSAEAHADDYRRLSGAEIKRLIAGKVVTDEVHYTDHFRAKGVYEGVFMNKRSTGTWAVKGTNSALPEDRKRKAAMRFGGRARSFSGANRPSSVRDTIIVLPERDVGYTAEKQNNQQGRLVMRLTVSLLLLALAASPTASFAQSELDTAKIEQVIGVKGATIPAEHVFKVTKARNDVKVQVDGWSMPPFMGLGSWAAFTPSAMARW